jgi:16S rRNA (adenine1518-N6/adenine1519-N6)-dimethyltransferase
MGELSSPRPDPTSRAALRALFRRHNFHPRRSLGQTFLVDANIVRKIVAAAELTGQGRVLEIGPGTGAVTRALVEAASRVVAIEIDPKLVAILRETVGEAAEVIEGDVLGVELGPLLSSTSPLPRAGLGEKREGQWRVVANLPYAITGPAIIRLLGVQEQLESMVVMVQQEVAERIAAPPGGRERGLLSVLVQSACKVKLVARVPRTCFWPQPRVDSAVLALAVRRPPLVPPQLRPVFTRVARAGFGKRRKTLLNALTGSQELALSKDAARALLAGCGIDSDRRAETLTETEFLSLARSVAASQREADT